MFLKHWYQAGKDYHGQTLLLITYIQKFTVVKFNNIGTRLERPARGTLAFTNIRKLRP